MNTMRGVALVLLGFAALLLAACGTSPPSSFYTLDDAGYEFTPDQETAYVLGIGPIRVPEYLERPHIVTRGEGAELRVDDFDRWAEPISRAHHRIIALNVDALLDGVIVVGFPYGPVIEYDAKLVGRIARFDMDTTGTTRLAVFWTIASIDGDILVEPTRHEYIETGGDPDDPNSIATAMSACLTQFSQDIAAAMRTLDDAGALVPASSPVP
jgi:uncharacterized lipoprotein YmbA